MNQLTDVIAEIQATATTAVSLPPPPAGAINFYTGIQATKKSVIQQIDNWVRGNAGQQISLPFMLLYIGLKTVDPDFGMDTWAQKRLPLNLYYVNGWGGANGNQDYVDSQAINISVAFDAPGLIFNTFQPYESAHISSDIDDEINEALAAASQSPLVSSVCQWHPGFFINVANYG